MPLEQLDADTARLLTRVGRRFSTRQRQDADLADALLRVLKSALGKQLRDKIKEVSTATD